MATRHRTQHMVGVVNWLMSGFSQPQTPGETPTDQSQKKKRWLREKQKELHLCLSELEQGAGRAPDPQGPGPGRTGAGICPFPGHLGSPYLPNCQQRGCGEGNRVAVEEQGHSKSELSSSPASLRPCAISNQGIALETEFPQVSQLPLSPKL